MEPYKLGSAFLIAQKSSHPLFHHVALVFRNGKMLSAACNHNWNHAETRALKQVPQDKRSKLTLYSLRFNKRGQLRLAKPCDNCYNALSDNGVKTLYYSDSNGKIVRHTL